MATAIAIATTSIILTLAMGFLFYLEVYKINKQVLEIQEQIHLINNEVSKLKQQAKKKYYPAQNKRQVIKG
jgi:cell division protein FtsL